ncbi:MAG: hypothetical protein JWQ49_3670 [Edaphobacter sp.]|nr:hypothetical protein [Edaphobacter sp.]
MKATTPLTRFVLVSILLAAAGIGVAQGPPGQDPYNPPPGHGGVPPGQAKKHGHDDDHVPPGQAKKYRNDDMPPGQAKKYRDDDLPPGQAKKYREDYHFRGDDRGRFYAHYRIDADQWRGRRRPVFVTGRVVPREYVIQTVPQTYWVGAPPPPPGYQYGYYGGYVVAYNPATRIVADVLDLVAAATSR